MNTSCTMLIGHIEFLRDRVSAHGGACAICRTTRVGTSLDREDSEVWGFRNDAYRSDRRRVQVRNRWPGVFAKSPFAHSEWTPIPTYGQYTAFIHWPFQRENTPLGRGEGMGSEVAYGPFDDSTNEDILRGRVVRMAGADEYLRTLAIARLYLDNVPNRCRAAG